MVERVDDGNRTLEDAVELIRGRLRQCAAANTELLCRSLDMDRGTLATALSWLIRSGEVEELRPSPDPRRVGGRQVHRRSPHYRLRRSTDSDYLWEQEVFVKLPAGRMSDTRELEGSRPCEGPVVHSWSAYRQPAFGV